MQMKLFEKRLDVSFIAAVCHGVVCHLLWSFNPGMDK